MGVPQSLAAVLALLALVLAVEGVTRGSTKQLFSGLLLAIVATLTFSFGDTLSTFNIQMVEQLPRWSDVPHPLPAPEPAPTPAPKAETMSTQAPVAYSINYSPTVSAKGYPRFLAIYPFEKFFELSKWQTPEQPFIKPLYQAIHSDDWSLANVKAQEGLDQLAKSDIANKYYYQAHLTWLRGIALMEMGKPADAVKVFDEAAKLMTYGNTSAVDVMRFQIDREIVNIYADRKKSTFMRDLMPDLLVSEDSHQQEIALLHYARALGAAEDGLGDTTNNELQAARDIADRMSHTKAVQPTGRLMTILNDPFGGVGREKMIAAIARMPKPTETATSSAAPVSIPTASPRFYAVYPREVFMSDVDWKNPAVPALAPLYDALEKGDWLGAFKLCNDGLDQTYSLPWVTGRYYRGHIIWLMAVAQLENGDQMQASDLLSTARKMITYSTKDNSDRDRMMIDVALFSDFANVPSSSLPYQVEGRNSQDQAMFHYAKALYYKGSGDNYNVGVDLNEAKAIVADMDMRGLHDQAARLRSVFAAQFPQ